MTCRRKLVVMGAVVFLTCAQAFPSDLKNRQPRQDEDEDAVAAPINVGASVAQIIAGAFTGNIDSIIKGSFGFIGDSTVNKLSHNTWETLKGNPTQTPPWATTTPKDDEEETEAPATPPPQPPKVQQQSASSSPNRPAAAAAPPPNRPATAAAAPPPPKRQEIEAPPPKRQEVQPPPPPPPPPAPTHAAAQAIVEPEPEPAVVAPPKRKVVAYRPVVEQELSFGSIAQPANLYEPDVYYPGSANYPTRPPRVRSTQPTYATLAPQPVINGVTEPEPNAQRVTTEEDDEEEEGLSAELESNGGASSTPIAQTYIGDAAVTTAKATVSANTDANIVTTTEEDDEDQDQIDYNYRF